MNIRIGGAVNPSFIGVWLLRFLRLGRGCCAAASTQSQSVCANGRRVDRFGVILQQLTLQKNAVVLRNGDTGEQFQQQHRHCLIIV